MCSFEEAGGEESVFFGSFIGLENAVKYFPG